MKNDPKQKKNNDDSIVSSFIIIVFSIISIFFESIIVFISLFKQGFYKREILSKKNDLGFDLIIKRK